MGKRKSREGAAKKPAEKTPSELWLQQDAYELDGLSLLGLTGLLGEFQAKVEDRFGAGPIGCVVRVRLVDLTQDEDVGRFPVRLLRRCKSAADLLERFKEVVALKAAVDEAYSETVAAIFERHGRGEAVGGS